MSREHLVCRAPSFPRYCTPNYLLSLFPPLRTAPLAHHHAPFQALDKIDGVLDEALAAQRSDMLQHNSGGLRGAGRSSPDDDALRMMGAGMTTKDGSGVSSTYLRAPPCHVRCALHPDPTHPPLLSSRTKRVVPHGPKMRCFPWKRCNKRVSRLRPRARARAVCPSPPGPHTIVFICVATGPPAPPSPHPRWHGHVVRCPTRDLNREFRFTLCFLSSSKFRRASPPHSPAHSHPSPKDATKSSGLDAEMQSENPLVKAEAERLHASLAAAKVSKRAPPSSLPPPLPPLHTRCIPSALCPQPHQRHLVFAHSYLRDPPILNVSAHSCLRSLRSRFRHTSPQCFFHSLFDHVLLRRSTRTTPSTQLAPLVGEEPPDPQRLRGRRQM